MCVNNRETSVRILDWKIPSTYEWKNTVWSQILWGTLYVALLCMRVRIKGGVYQWQPGGRRSGVRSLERPQFRRADVSKFGKTTGRWRVTLGDITEDGEQWRELVAASVTETSLTTKTRANPIRPDSRRLIYAYITKASSILQHADFMQCSGIRHLLWNLLLATEKRGIARFCHI